jgi:hypothetical protein
MRRRLVAGSRSVIDERHSRWLCGSWLSVVFAAAAFAEVKQSGLVFPGTSSPFVSEWLGVPQAFLNPVTNGMFLSASLFAVTVLRRKPPGKLALCRDGRLTIESHVDRAVG